MKTSQSWETLKGVNSGDLFATDVPEPTQETPSATQTAQAFFEQTGIVVSPTAEGQRWQIPGTEDYIPAHEARNISLQVRQAVGEAALSGDQ